MGAQTKPSVLPIYTCVPCYCSGWGHHPRLPYAVESRKKVGTLAVQSGSESWTKYLYTRYGYNHSPLQVWGWSFHNPALQGGHRCLHYLRMFVGVIFLGRWANKQNLPNTQEKINTVKSYTWENSNHNNNSHNSSYS